ncbi:MAG: zinc ABC transporter substrate-binding protein [Desulfuromonas sp.]|nr:MAG: zinc ABC transporter substrate-binding protein [Desulfuromonas sp.]
MKKILMICFVLLGTFLGSSLFAAESPRVVVSIKPLHSLVSGVMQGVGEPALLVKGGGSPHGYSLKPSEARALAQADLVVWVGPELETFLEKPLVTLAHSAQQLALAGELHDDLLEKRDGGAWESGHHDEHEGHGHEHGGDASDLHLWLSPKLAQKIVQLVGDRLMALDPPHQLEYAANTASLIQRLDRFDQGLARQLAPVKDVPYVVFHAAYQYFETAYGLNAVGSVTIDPERKPGAKKILEIRNKIHTLNARCVFSEPQFESRLIATIIEGTDCRTGVLDPLGADIPAGPDAYFTLLQRLADNLEAGLK